jgi:hypothetical protein
MSRWIRNSHRWLGMALIVLTIVNFIAFGTGNATPWLYYSPLVPLFLSMLTGLYMFVVHYAHKPRSA